MSKRVAMENEFGRNAEEDFVAHQEMEDLFGAFSIDRNSSEDFLHGGNGQAGVSEGGFDLGFGGSFVGIEAYGGAGWADIFALDIDFFCNGEIGERCSKCLGTHESSEAGAEIFTGDSGRKRIRAMELFDAGEDFFSGVVVERGCDKEQGIGGGGFGAIGGDDFLRGGLNF